ncbi:hypothetical protein GOV12_01830 [Candidatus Pacearchaeota archaeon]|nr:hypothetical protein [Candidatus Pacearchaeota archaeon]
MHIVRFFETENIEYSKIIIDKNDSSSPLYGKRDDTITPKPNTENNPIPHAAHAGANIPRNIPIDDKNPIFV